MVVYFIPIVPVIIFLFLLATGLVGEVLDALNTIHVILGILFGCGYLYTFIHVLRNSASETRKVGGIVCTVLSCIVAFVALEYFISSLASIEHSVFMVFEFAFGGIIGGLLLFLLVFGSIHLCLTISGS